MAPRSIDKNTFCESDKTPEIFKGKGNILTNVLQITLNVSCVQIILVYYACCKHTFL